MFVSPGSKEAAGRFPGLPNKLGRKAEKSEQTVSAALHARTAAAAIGGHDNDLIHERPGPTLAAGPPWATLPQPRGLNFAVQICN